MADEYRQFMVLAEEVQAHIVLIAEKIREREQTSDNTCSARLYFEIQDELKQVRRTLAVMGNMEAGKFITVPEKRL